MSFASLSLDLDNLWSYLKIHGDSSWRDLPTYLPAVIPRVLDFFAERNLTLTIFVVGLDAEQPRNREALRELSRAGHEIGNHSYLHEPWIARAGRREAYDEIARAHAIIAAATGREPCGFRGPGFATSPALLEALARLRYRYDASRLPTFIGPLARWYYFRQSDLSPQERSERRALFGSWHDVFARNRQHRIQTSAGRLVEIPVTTMPGLRLPIHFSYLHYLDARSPKLADRYFSAALDLCRVTGTPPSLLLHPLDFLGFEDAGALRFFPGMDVPRARKMETTARLLEQLRTRFPLVTMEQHACA